MTYNDTSFPSWLVSSYYHGITEHRVGKKRTQLVLVSHCRFHQVPGCRYDQLVQKIVQGLVYVE